MCFRIIYFNTVQTSVGWSPSTPSGDDELFESRDRVGVGRVLAHNQSDQIVGSKILQDLPKILPNSD